MRGRVFAVVLLGLSCGSATENGNGDGPPAGEGLRLAEVVSGLDSPVHLTSPAGDPRLFIVEQPGRIRIVANGQLRSQPFLDIVSLVGSGGERGLLSLAFHPDYADNGRFFVYYTDRSGDTRVVRYQVSGDPNVADANSAQLVLTVAQPFANHNGGLILFGPDGKLYIGLGDGGSGGDPLGHGQNRGTLLGTILRIDVDAGNPYAVPPDNPFVNTQGARGEIWAWGLRNPWRFAFDRTAGLLYIADVGQNEWEEVNVAPATAGGLNYGWSIMEGQHCFRTETCSVAGLTLPALEYNHSDGCSITGGVVYRGSAVPALVGHYVYSDYCEGWIRSFRFANGSVTDERDWRLDGGRVLSFGEDAAGEIYVLSANGRVYRIEAE